MKLISGTEAQDMLLKTNRLINVEVKEPITLGITEKELDIMLVGCKLHEVNFSGTRLNSLALGKTTVSKFCLLHSTIINVIVIDALSHIEQLNLCMKKGPTAIYISRKNEALAERIHRAAPNIPQIETD